LFVVCEQPRISDKEICPHCQTDNQISLELSPDEFNIVVNELRNKLKHKEDPEVRSEVVKLLYSQAMKLRYVNTSESLSLFEEVIKMDPKHWESRLKISWISIRLTNCQRAIEVLLPVVNSADTTMLQKQRAFTNLSCAENWKDKALADYIEAENWARKGIALDGEGSGKLWENLATALKYQNKLGEARIAFKQALILNPKSINAIERQASIDRHLRIQKKKEGKQNLFNLVSPRGMKNNQYKKL